MPWLATEISSHHSPSRQSCNHAPIWQLASRIRGRLYVVVKLVNRATHVHYWELPGRVGDTPEAAELFMPTSSVSIVQKTIAKGHFLHFQASERVDRRRHLRCQKREATPSSTRDSAQRWSSMLKKRRDRSYLVVRECFADVARCRLSIVRI